MRFGRSSRIARRIAQFGNDHRDAALPLLLTAVGLAISSDILAVVGVFGVLVVEVLHFWQLHALDAVRYSRHLDRPIMEFGATVELVLEYVNDKPLPLSYLRVADEFPEGLTVDGVGRTFELGLRQSFVQVLPLLPYARVRRRYTVHGDRRGEHRFGPAVMTSGDPVGRGSRSLSVPTAARLVVFPKTFALIPDGIASRMLVGDTLAQRSLVTDPSRIAGVRTYVSGDPLRHVDWRASARVGSLLVRQFEATTHHRIAVLLDALIPGREHTGSTSDETEFAIAVAASLVSEFARRGFSIGLFATGYVDGLPVAHIPSSVDTTYREIMESLAKLVPHGRLSFADIIGAADTMTGTSTTFVTVSPALSPTAVLAIAEARRRHRSVSAVLVDLADSPAPASTGLDLVLHTPYVVDWHHADSIELSR